MVTRELILEAADEITNLLTIKVIPRFVALDVYALSCVFDNDQDFKKVMAIIIQTLKELDQGNLEGEDLVFSLSDWKSYHFQSTCSPKRGEEDLRAVYRREDVLNLLGFGHRYIPTDFYSRIKSRA